MGTTLGELTKLVLKKMASNGEIMTPKAYAQAFCQEAKAQGVSLEECEELPLFIEKLDPTTKEMLKRYNVKCVDDLLLFLIYRIKALHEGEKKEGGAKKILEDMILSQLATFIGSLLSPSVSHELDQEIITMKQKLQMNPSLITSEPLQKEIKSLVVKRVVFDRKEIREEITSINRMVDALSKKTIGSVIAHQESQKALASVQHEVTQTKFDTIGEQNFFDPLHKKLVVLLDVLERQSQSLLQALEESHKEVEQLKKRVDYLENSVSADAKTLTCDVVTNLFNEKGWNIQIEGFEQRFCDTGENYCVALFEIDYVEDIRRRYGEDATDVVTRTFGQILAKKVRIEDLVARVKNDRFVVTFAHISPEVALSAVTKIHEAIAKTKFLYKEEVITVTGSVGVTCRSKHSDIQAMILDADRALHKAIKAGRNSVAV